MQKIVIRIDDLGRDEEKSRKVLEMFLRHSLPVFCQVVPAWLTRGFISHFIALRNDCPRLMIINQHGFSHQSHNNGDERSYEFGPARTYTEQYQDILRGKEILEETFADAFWPFFTAPHDRYDQNTVLCLERLRYIGLFGPHIGPVTPASAATLQHIPCVDGSSRKQGRRVALSCAELQERMTSSPLALSGLVFHPLEFSSLEQIEQVAFLLDHMRREGTMQLLDCSYFMKAL